MKAIKSDINPMIDTDNTKENGGSNTLLKVLLVLFAIALAGTVFFYREVKVLEQDPNKVNEEKIVTLVEKVNKIIALPEGEMPVLAEVSDLTPLAGNKFFAKAKVGDQVLLYTAARKAYLYDPKANIIIEVASLDIGDR